MIPRRLFLLAPAVLGIPRKAAAEKPCPAFTGSPDEQYEVVEDGRLVEFGFVWRDGERTLTRRCRMIAGCFEREEIVE